MPDMTPTSLAAAVAPHTGKIIKDGLRVFERREHLLQNSYTVCPYLLYTLFTLL